MLHTSYMPPCCTELMYDAPAHRSGKRGLTQAGYIRVTQSAVSVRTRTYGMLALRGRENADKPGFVWLRMEVCEADDTLGGCGSMVGGGWA